MATTKTKTPAMNSPGCGACLILQCAALRLGESATLMLWFLAVAAFATCHGQIAGLLLAASPGIAALAIIPTMKDHEP